MLSLNLRTLSDDEKERLYYQAGLPEIATMYAEIVDVRADNDLYEEQVGKMFDAADYEKLEKLVEHLQEHIHTARIALDDLYQWAENSKTAHPTGDRPPTRKQILTRLAAIELDEDTEP